MAFSKRDEKTKEKKMTPSVSVIIPTLNEARAIVPCVKSLKRQSKEPLEIIIADSHSEDGTDKIAEEMGCKVVYARKGSPGIARNAAAKVAKGDILAFTDADSIVSEDWVERVGRDFKEMPEVIGIGGVQESIDGGMMDSVYYLIQLNFLPRLGEKLGIRGLSTANCAFRKDAFLRSGGFDESLSMFEDGELSWRMRKQGRLYIDSHLSVKTSARRLHQIGALKLNVLYWKCYYCLFTKRPIKDRYFDQIEH